MLTILRHPPCLEVADLARSGRDSPGSQGAGLGAGAGFSKTKGLSRAVLSSLGLTLGRRACAVTRLMTRAMYRSIESRASWCDSIVISDSVITELTFWQSNFELMNGFSITHQHAPAPDMVAM